jgi:hypothetical protein
LKDYQAPAPRENIKVFEALKCFLYVFLCVDLDSEFI